MLWLSLSSEQLSWARCVTAVNVHTLKPLREARGEGADSEEGGHISLRTGLLTKRNALICIPGKAREEKYAFASLQAESCVLL